MSDRDRHHDIERDRRRDRDDHRDRDRDRDCDRACTDHVRSRHSRSRSPTDRSHRQRHHRTPSPDPPRKRHRRDPVDEDHKHHKDTKKAVSDFVNGIAKEQKQQKNTENEGLIEVTVPTGFVVKEDNNLSLNKS
ncbi:hypothetical protein RYX36_031658 [Vicia faba]